VPASDEPAARVDHVEEFREGLRREQAAKRADPTSPTLMGIGLATFTEIVGAGPTKVCDILGIGLFDSCEIRVHPTGGVIARLGTMSQGQGHATTYAQIIATELGLPASDIVVEEGDMSAHLTRLLKQAGQDAPKTRPILEINPQHALIQRLQSDAAPFDDLAHIVFDQAWLAEGGQLEDPATFVKRLNELMLTLAGSGPSRIWTP